MIEGALTERYNKSVRGFDFTATQQMEAAVKANLAIDLSMGSNPDQFFVRGGLTFAGVVASRAVYTNRRRRISSPRFGFAYKLTDTTILRAAVSFGFLAQRRSDVNQIDSAPLCRSTSRLITVSFIETLGNPFETYKNGLPAAIGSSLGIQTFLGRGYHSSIPDLYRHTISDGH
ncbi:MAG: hypothetical protein IPM55_18025 [Acidobacteria bacterium]|nr:hypothetical protein [Acidobacteriota bacterium]